MKPSEYKKIQQYIEWLLDEWEYETIYDVCMLIASELNYAVTEKNAFKRSRHMYETANKLDVSMINLYAIFPKMVDKVFDYAESKILAQNKTLDDGFEFGEEFYQQEEYNKQYAKNQFQRMYYGIVSNDKTFKDIKNTFVSTVSVAEMQGIDSTEAVERQLQKISTNIGDRGICAYNPDDKRITTITAKAKEVVGYSVEQLTQANAKNIGEIFDTDYVEVTAHYGARPTHAVWQGKVYKIHGEEEGYPNLYTATELGQVTGLKGINCRHDYFPFILGKSVREYTDEELEAMLPENNKFLWQGKEYDGYTSTQRQRYFERKLKSLKEKLVMYDAFHLRDEFDVTAIQYRQVLRDYNEFSLVAKLPPQVDRYQVPQYNTKLNYEVYKVLDKGIA